MLTFSTSKHDIEILSIKALNTLKSEDLDPLSYPVIEEDHDLSFEYDFGNLHPKYIEYTNIFPEFPKSAIEGFITAMQIPESILNNEEKVKELKKAMQYTLTNVGVGLRPKKNVPFFNRYDARYEDEEDIVEMQYGRRRCAGVKVCEFFPKDLRVSHTEVDPVEGNLV